MLGYAIYKDVIKYNNKEKVDEIIAKYPFFLITDLDVTDKNTLKNLKKIFSICEYKYKNKKRKEKDYFRFDLLTEEKIKIFKLDYLFKNKNDLLCGDLESFIDYYVNDLGYNNYQEFENKCLTKKKINSI